VVADMSFWYKNVIFALILIGLAYYFLSNPGLIKDLKEQFDETSLELSSGGDESSGSADGKELEKIEQELAKAPVPVTKKSTNAAAEGLSRFYANLHGETDGDEPRVRNNIVYLPEPKGSLVELLEARRLVTRPLRKTWRGTKDNRPFRKGHTLHQKLSEYAEADGLEVIWWLNRDFIIKDPFRVDKDIIQTTYQISRAIEGHFQDGLSAYFCYKERAIVLSEKDYSYLDDECTKLEGKNRRRY